MGKQPRKSHSTPTGPGTKQAGLGPRGTHVKVGVQNGHCLLGHNGLGPGGLQAGPSPCSEQEALGEAVPGLQQASCCCTTELTPHTAPKYPGQPHCFPGGCSLRPKVQPALISISRPVN